MRFILRLKRRLRKATSANKIIIDKKEAKSNAREARETKANARVTTTTTTIATTIVDKKQLSKLCKQLTCTHVNLVLKIASMLLSCLLLFDNLRKCINNALYNQRLIKLLN